MVNFKVPRKYVEESSSEEPSSPKPAVKMNLFQTLIKEKEVRVEKDPMSLKSLLKKLRSPAKKKYTEANKRVSVMIDQSNNTIEKILSDYKTRKRKNSVIVTKPESFDIGSKLLSKTNPKGNFLRLKTQIQDSPRKMSLKSKKDVGRISKNSQDQQRGNTRNRYLAKVPLVPILKTVREKIKAIPIKLDLSVIDHSEL